LNTGWQWCNINHLLSIDVTGYSCNPPMDFITSSPVLQTQSVNKHKYYYYNLHNFMTLSSCLTHTVSTQPQILLLTINTILSSYLVLSDTYSQNTNTNIITIIYTILSSYLVLSDTQSEHKHKYYYYNLHNFIIISCPVWHTQSEHKHKYYYYNPHNFIITSCPVWHTQSEHKHKYYYYNPHNFIIISCPVW
jgi:hypothetical protein